MAIRRTERTAVTREILSSWASEPACHCGEAITLDTPATCELVEELDTETGEYRFAWDEAYHDACGA